MGNLRPIGSEKLQGMDKINRMIEISRYKENTPSSINESRSTEYSIVLADGNKYQIIKERAGYIIKKAINESENDYIAPMKNRHYYPSYSQAFKRMNLMAKEMNTLFENEQGTSLYNESKKYILKRKSTNEEMGMGEMELDEQEVSATTPAPAPAPVPAPAPTPEELPTPAPEEEEPNFDEMGKDDEDDNEPVTIKVIQKLTGKLAQKIREFNSSEEEDMSGNDVKYVINSVLSSLSLENLNDEDVAEIIDRLEGSEEEGMGQEPGMGEEHGMGEEMPMEPAPEGEMSETMNLGDALTKKIPSAYGANMKKELNMGYDMMDSEEEEDLYDDELHSNEDKFERESREIERIERELNPDAYPKHGSKMKQRSYPHLSHGTFGESKVDKIISKYFNVENSEKSLKEEKQQKLNKEMKDFDKSEIVRLSESIRQEKTAMRFMEKNPRATLVGITNKKNLIFKDGLTESKITPKGEIL